MSENTRGRIIEAKYQGKHRRQKRRGAFLASLSVLRLWIRVESFLIVCTGIPEIHYFQAIEVGTPESTYP
jgi:hypothetical protein